jgi:hypothetical protein
MSEQTQQQSQANSTQSQDGYLRQCPVCGCRDLFIRKDFPQKIGLAVVIAAGVAFLVLAASRRLFYIGVILLALSVVVDAVLYWFVPMITVCYKCRVELRDHPVAPHHHGFDLAIAEKYRRPAGGAGEKKHPA